MAGKKFCSTCRKDITNDTGSVIFNCPACDKEEIVRCKNCREIGARYTCNKCEFSGPN